MDLATKKRDYRALYRKIEIHRCVYIDVEGFVSKRRFFDLPECGGCIYKGGSYCWGQCSFNVWKRDNE